MDDDSAASDEPGAYDQLEVVVSELVGTHVDIGWTTPDSTQSFIEFGTDTSYGTRIDSGSSAADEHQISLSLLVAGTEYHFRIGAQVDGEEVVGADHTFTTSSPPLELPEFELVASDPDLATPGLAAITLIGGHSSAAVIDRQGRYRWWHVEENQGGLITRARLSEDGTAVLFNLFWNEGDDTVAKIIRTSLDGSVADRRAVPDAHHDFVELPGGDVAALVYDSILVDDVVAKGDKIILLPADTDDTAELWSVWDDFEYVHYDYPDGAGWSHANAIDYDPAEDVFYVGLRQQGCILKIDRSTGDLQWKLGTTTSDFEIVEEDRFRQQHQFQVLSDSVLIFDNGSTEDLASRAVEFGVDTDTWTAPLQWTWEPDPALYVGNLGDVHRFDSGNTLVTLSSLGQIVEVDADGTVLSELHTPIGHALGYLDWIGEI